MDERWETTTTVVLNLLYVAMVAAMFVMIVPGVRTRLAALGGRQAFAWRYGRWLASQTPPPQWTRQLVREDLPQESV